MDTAISCYEKALSIKPDYAEAHYNLGFSHHRLGQLDAAVRSYSLLKSARYAHSDDYILNIASDGFTVIDSQEVSLRKEKKNWIDGKIFIFQAS